MNRTRAASAQADERVMVAADPERAGAMARHLDLGFGVGLDPDRRLRLPDVAQQRTEDELGHRETSTSERLEGAQKPDQRRRLDAGHRSPTGSGWRSDSAAAAVKQKRCHQIRGVPHRHVTDAGQLDGAYGRRDPRGRGDEPVSL